MSCHVVAIRALSAAGIPTVHIVLGDRIPEIGRQTGFAVA
jgi:hypothetical protein